MTDRPEFNEDPDDTARRLDAECGGYVWTAEAERDRLPHGAGIIIAIAAGGLIAAIAFAAWVAL